MRRLTLLLCLCVVGCAGSVAKGPEPAKVHAQAFPRLKVGAAGIASGVATGSILLELHPAGGGEWSEGDKMFMFPYALEGDRLIVLDDSEDSVLPTRRVKVRLESGTYAGSVHLMEREDIKITSIPGG